MVFQNSFKTYTNENCKTLAWRSHWGSMVITQLVSMRMRVQSPASLSGLRIWHCCELWHRSQTCIYLIPHCCGWRRLAAEALIQPLAWKLPYAVGVAPKRQKKKKACSWLAVWEWNIWATELYFQLYKTKPQSGCTNITSTE